MTNQNNTDKLNNENSTTVRNMFKDNSNKQDSEKKDNNKAPYNIIDLHKVLYLEGNSLEELEALVNDAYNMKATDGEVDYHLYRDVNHAREICEFRTPIRIAKGKEVIYWELIDDWCNFVRHFSKTPVPFNYEIESILKYLVKFKEAIYSDEEIFKQIVDEFRDLNNPSNLFIIANIGKYSSRTYPLAKAVINAKKAEYAISKEVQEQAIDLMNRGISEKQALPLIGAKIAKLFEDEHDLADVIVFPNGNIEGIDSEGNWILMREIKIENNGTFFILYKVNQESVMRYIINKDTNVALVTNENGTYKTKATKKISIEEYSNLSIKRINDQIESIITEISVVGISHDKSHEIAKEIIELCNPINNETDTFKVEEVFEEELKQLKKSYE